MKNAHRLVGFITLAVVIGFGFVACDNGGGVVDEGGDKTEVNLAVPSLTINTETKTASWTAVANANTTNGYTIKVDSSETVVNSTSYSLANINAGTHQISVKTNGYETDTHIYKGSAYCTAQPFTVSEDSGGNNEGGNSMQNAIELVIDTWADGSIAAGGEEWFKFTATADTQYIHFQPDTLNDVYVQLYDNTDTVIGNRTNLYNSNRYILRSVTSGNEYYIRVTPYSSVGSGAYKIGFTASTTAPTKVNLPTANVTTLTFNTWAGGSITTDSEQWFKFTATADTQYIHYQPGTLSSVYVQLYDSTGVPVGTQTYLSSNISRTLTSGNEYYIKVTPYSSNGSGAYKIAFNSCFEPPDTIELTADIWTDGFIASSGGVQWFKFTATSNYQYIHFRRYALSRGANVQLYDNNGATVGNTENLGNYSGYVSYAGRSVTSGNVYYIRVTPYTGSGSGTYKIGFTASTTAPTKVILPTENITTLDYHVWTDSSIVTESEQWFKFKATATTQYIHVSFGTLNSLIIELYDSSGVQVGEIMNGVVSDSRDFPPYIYRTVTKGDDYYIRVTPSSGGESGTYRIGFTASTTAPSKITLPDTNVITLAYDTWSGTYDGEQWFKFTATAVTQYIHFSCVSGDYYYFVTVKKVYDNNGIPVDGITGINNNQYSINSLTSGNEYYFNVIPTDDSIEYKVGFTASSTAPSN